MNLHNQHLVYFLNPVTIHIVFKPRHAVWYPRQASKMPPKEPSRLKKWFKELKVWKRVALGVSVAALIFTILGLYAAFTANQLAERSMELQQWSNNASWLSYLAALEGNRIALMQFCVNNTAAVGCENVIRWSSNRAYLNTSLVPNLYPPDPLNTSAGASSEDTLTASKSLLSTKTGKSFVAGSFIGSLSVISAIVLA